MTKSGFLLIGSPYLWRVPAVQFNNINSQIDATMKNFIDNYNQLNMFRASSGALDCVYSLWYNAPAMLQLLRMGEIITRNMLSWL